MSAVLYDYWRSTASYRVRIALNLAKVNYTSVPVDLIAGDHRTAEHKARNPQGFVPVLEIDGLRLTQSLAIIEYLDETRKLGLLPINPADRARVRKLSLVLAADTHPICNPSVVEQTLNLVPKDARDKTRANWMQHFIRRGLSAFEVMLDHPATGHFCHGNAVTMADLCLVPQIYNARRWEVDWSDLLRIKRIVEMAIKGQAFRAAEPETVKSVR